MGNPRKVLIFAMGGLILLLIHANVLVAGMVFEKSGENLAKGGDFEGDVLSTVWKFDTNNGGMSIKKGKGRVGGTSVELTSTSTHNRGKLWGDFMVPVGADIKVTVWVKSDRCLGGILANLEGLAAPKNFNKFNIAGGTYGWTQYTLRTTIDPALSVQGDMKPLQIWFYIYGIGKVSIDDLEIVTIEPNGKAEAAWAEKRVQDIVAASGNWQGAKPGNIGAWVSAGTGENTVKQLDLLVKYFACAASGSTSWGMLATNALTKVFRDTPLRSSFTTTMKIEMLRHEFEGAQLVLLAYDNDLHDVRVSLSELKGPGMFETKHVSILPVGYGQRFKGDKIFWYNGHDTRYWPDALLPNRSFTVKQGTAQPVYVRVYCPKDTQPGIYRGTINIRSKAGTAKFPLEIKVHNASMPIRLHLKTMMVAGKKDKPYLDLALEQRLGIGTLYTGMSWTNHAFPIKGNSFDFSGVEQELQYAIDRGLNSFVVAQTPKSGKWGFPENYSDAWKNKMKKMVVEYSAFLKSKGWFEMAYYNNIDEPWDTRWTQVKEIYAMVKSVQPDIKVFSCVNKVGALNALQNHADTFDVYIQQHGQQQGRARLEEGKEIWWAVCIWPSEHPNLFIEYPLTDARVMGWMAFQNNISGFEYWAMNSWDGDWKPVGQKAPQDGSWMKCANGVLVTEWQYGRKSLNGDGYLVYPGDNGQPINSLRFEALRDGIEEHELLCQLKECFGKLSGADQKKADVLLNGGDGLVTNNHLFVDDPSRFIQVRGQILDILDKVEQ